jgi:phospholipase/carboxylesterase
LPLGRGLCTFLGEIFHHPEKATLMRPLLLLLSLGFTLALSGSTPGDPGAPQDSRGGLHSFVLRAVKVQTVDVLLPAGFNEDIAYPLLVVLHGNGGTAEGFLQSFRGYRKKHMIVAAPQGQYSRLIGGRIGFSWFAEAGGKGLWEYADPMCVESLTEVIREMTSKYKTRSVFVLGFSQGASAAYMVGLLHPSRVAGVIALSGGLPAIGEEGGIVTMANVEEARSVKVFVARGKDDPAVGHEVYERQREFLSSHGFEVTPLEFEGSHSLTDDLLEAVAAWIDERS